MLTNSICSSNLNLPTVKPEKGSKKLRQIAGDFFCGFLLYCGSLGYQAFFFLALFGVCVWITHQKTADTAVHRGQNLLTGLLILTGLSVLNNVLGIVSGEAQVNAASDYIPYLSLVAFTVFFQRFINEDIWHWFIIFVLLEIVIALFLKEAGIKNLWGVNMSEGTFLYDQKVAALSTNSSNFGYKILNATIIFEFLKSCNSDKKFLPRIVFYPLVLVGVYLSFNRTTIISLSLFGFLLFCVNYRVISSKIKLLLLLSGIAVIIVCLYNLETIMYEFFRGDLDFQGNALSERPDVFAHYTDFLMKHPFSGNFSFKLWSDIFGDGRLFHPHNSYLLTLTAHGFLISSVFFLLIMRYINKRNLPFLIPFFVAGILQSYMFWGISVNDILFYYLLLFNLKTKKTSLEINTTGEKCTL